MTNPGLSRRLFIKNNAVIAAGSMFVPGWIRKNSFSESDSRADGIKDVLKPADSASIQGMIGRKLDQSSQNRVFAQNVDELIEPFKHRTETRLWQTEFWGKWFTSAILAYKYRPDPEKKKILDRAVKELIATQTPDGYIGNYRPENHLQQWDIWGRKYCLLGLLDYFELTGDPASLKAAVALVNHLMKELTEAGGKIVNKGNYRGMPSSSILGGIVRLYNNTLDQKYLQFAEDIVGQWETPEGPKLISKSKLNVGERFPLPTAKNWYSWEQGQKAYEMMSCYEGLIALYRVTGKKSYLEAVVNTWDNIRSTEINLAGSGASYEMWFGGAKHQTSPVMHYQETCVTVTWIKFSQELLRLTGKAKYAHEIERSYYNALLAALSADGAVWAKYTPLNGARLPGSGQCGMTLNCCEANGPRGQFTLPFTAVMSSSDGVFVNFFVEGSFKSTTPSGKEVTLVQKTDYPVSGNIKLNLKMAIPEAMTISIRIPEWSLKTTLLLNGENIDVTAGAYKDIKKIWSTSDELSLCFDMRGRLIKQGETHIYSAIQSGPIVLCRDTRLSKVGLGVTVTPVQDKDGFIALKTIERSPDQIAATDNVWIEKEASFAPEFYKDAPETPQLLPVALCDYASAGNGHSPSSFQVWMPQLYDPRVH